jgi:hypothetical protein
MLVHQSLYRLAGRPVSRAARAAHPMCYRSHWPGRRRRQPALLDVFERDVQRRFAAGDRRDRDAEALWDKVRRRLAEAGALVAEQVLGRNPAVVEEQLGGVAGVLAALVDPFPALEASILAR